MSTLDIEKKDQLTQYLRAAGHVGTFEKISMQTLTGGVSNRTVLVTRQSGEQWVVKQALAKLRVPVDWFSSPERIHREALALRWLPYLTPPATIPRLVFEDTKHHVLAMEAVEEPFANWKEMLLSGDLQRDHVIQFAHILATIHARAYLRRTELGEIFADTRYFESLRLEPYYAYTAQAVPAAAHFLENLIADTRTRTITLVHGDYSPKNILVHQGKLVLLDHEVIHFGDPAFDLGFSLTHLLSKANHLAALRRKFAGAAKCYWTTYSNTLNEVGGLPWLEQLEQHAVRHTLACLLARVAGRSPLEYLNDEARRRQGNTVKRLMHKPPATVHGLIDEFTDGLPASVCS